MRKLVRENIEFKRNQGVETSLNIGQSMEIPSPFNLSDTIEGYYLLTVEPGHKMQYMIIHIDDRGFPSANTFTSTEEELKNGGRSYLIYRDRSIDNWRSFVNALNVMKMIRIPDNLISEVGYPATISKAE